MTLRVAGIQMPVTRNIDSNLDHILNGITWAHSQEADILLTPEGSVSGYTHEFDQSHTERAIETITQTAKQAGIGLALGTCFVEPEDEKCYNQVRFYDKAGTYLGFHAKILRTGSMSESPVGEINHYATCPLRTFDFHGLTIGGLICNDLWANPVSTPDPDTHLTHELYGMGAQVILHAVNGGRSSAEWSDVNWAYHSSNLRMRARASKIWIVTVDSSEPVDIRCSAPSGVIDLDGTWQCQTKDTGNDRFVYTIRFE